MSRHQKVGAAEEGETTRGRRRIFDDTASSFQRRTWLEVLPGKARKREKACLHVVETNSTLREHNDQLRRVTSTWVGGVQPDDLSRRVDQKDCAGSSYTGSNRIVCTRKVTVAVVVAGRVCGSCS